jgi:cystathionine gamma-synthase
MADHERWRPESLAAQALGWIDETTKAVIPPIHLATTFIRDADNQYRTGRSYGRADNPTYDQPERLLAELEGGVAAMTFASGMAAATAVFQALRPGDHVVAPRVMYWGLRKWLLGFATDWGLRVELIDGGDLDALRAAVVPGRTRLVWLETPANPTWVISDVGGAAEIAHRAGAVLAVDSTVATPVLTRPLALGADLVMHAGTKYLNGHSDVMAGALVTARTDALWERIATIRHDNGAILGGVEAWLLLRGMRTLFLRVERCCRSAQAIAEHFARDRRVRAVLYPGLPTHPGHAVAARQMRGGFGGMLSLCVAGGEAAAIATAAHVGLWKRATSLGGVESLIEHRASIEGAGTPAPPDLLRLSVGIEHVDDLIADLDQALPGQ